MAFKVEDQEIDINKILADISPENNEKYTPEKILDIEMFVIDVLKYHLIIFSPFRSLTGLEFEICVRFYLLYFLYLLYLLLIYLIVYLI